MRFIAVGSDLALLTKTAQDVVRAVLPKQAGEDVAKY
jgi:hypothetical protein